MSKVVFKQCIYKPNSAGTLREILNMIEYIARPTLDKLIKEVQKGNI